MQPGSVCITMVILMMGVAWVSLYPSSLLNDVCASYFQANEVLMGGRKLTAAEAYERGLVTRIFNQDEFKQKVKETVGELAKMPPQVSNGGRKKTHLTDFFFFL